MTTGDATDCVSHGNDGQTESKSSSNNGFGVSIAATHGCTAAHQYEYHRTEHFS